jgi:hypothetical protein
MRTVRIRVRIESPHPLVCRKGRLNGAVLRMRPEKPWPCVIAVNYPHVMWLKYCQNGVQSINPHGVIQTCKYMLYKKCKYIHLNIKLKIHKKIDVVEDRRN